MIKLTACVIVKNEAQNIGKWLACMKKLADEIVVVDTGSTDDTVAIVERAGVRPFSFPWTGDFAAAKNYALAQAHGNWIAFLDADETFTPDSIRRIPALLRRLHPQVKIAGIMCRLVNIDPAQQDKFIGASVQLRLFRNLSTLRYRGRIHEALTVPKNRAIELVKEIEIIHTGYSQAIIRRKLQRNLDLLQEKIASQQGEATPRDNRYLMDCYYGLGDYERGRKYAELALSQSEAMEDALPHIHMIRVSTYLFGKKKPAEFLQVIDEAIQACPHQPDFSMMKGLYLFEQKDYLAAADNLERAFALHAQYRLDVEGVTDNLERFLPGAWWARGEMAALRGAEEEAREDWLQALQVYRYHTASLRRLVQSLTRAGVAAVDIIGLLQELYQADDADFLADALAGQGGDVAVYYAAHAAKKYPARDYLTAGRYDAAAGAAADDLAWLYLCGIADALGQPQAVDGKLSLLLPPDYQAAWQALAQGKAVPQEMQPLAQAIGRMRQLFPPAEAGEAKTGKESKA